MSKSAILPAGSTTTIRVTTAIRDELASLAAADFHGVSASDAIRRLIDGHRDAKAIAAMDHFRATDPDGWEAYVAEADAFQSAVAPSLADDPWDEAA